MNQKDQRGFLNFSNMLLRMMTMLLALAATYFLTIQSLKLELADKAGSDVVITLDKKLGSFEVFLKEGVIGKEEFYLFSSEIESRLTRIEYMLIDRWGKKIEKP